MITVRQYIDKLILENSNAVTPMEYYYDLRSKIKEQGYVCVTVPLNLKYDHDHTHWLLDKIGFENYNWIGLDYWFNEPKHAILFALTWC